MINFSNLFLGTKKKRIILIVLMAILIIAIWLAIYFNWSSKEENLPEEIVPVEEPTSSVMKSGDVGGLPKEEGKTEEEILREVNPEVIDHPVRAPGTQMPSVIFNTTGVVVSIQEDGIIIEGNGSNFEDQKSRNLNIKFTDKTITFEKGKVARYQGLDGLNYLFAGDKVSIESLENIRGKTDFSVSYINKT